MSIGERILDALNKSGKNQAELARHLDTKTSTINGWIKGGRVPSAAVIVPICELTNVSVNWLLTGKNEPERQTIAITGDNSTAVAVNGSGNTITNHAPVAPVLEAIHELERHLLHAYNGLSPEGQAIVVHQTKSLLTLYPAKV